MVTLVEYNKILKKNERRTNRSSSLEDEVNINLEEVRNRRIMNIYGTASVFGTLTSVVGCIAGSVSLFDSIWAGVGYFSASLLVYSLSHLAGKKAIEIESKTSRYPLNFKQNL